MKCEFKQDAVASILAGCKKNSGQRRREVNTRCQRVTCNWCKKQQPALILTHQESGVKVFIPEVSELKDVYQLSTYRCCTRVGQRNWVTLMSSFCVVGDTWHKLCVHERDRERGVEVWGGMWISGLAVGYVAIHVAVPSGKEISKWFSTDFQGYSRSAGLGTG